VLPACDKIDVRPVKQLHTPDAAFKFSPEDFLERLSVVNFEVVILGDHEAARVLVEG